MSSVGMTNPDSKCAPIQNLTQLVAYLDGPNSLARQLTTQNLSSQIGFIRRIRNRLIDVNGNTFKIVGPNIYWLGLDENVIPGPYYPSQTRVLEILSTAAMMGATTVRSTTLGVSVGNPLSVWPANNITNNQALDVISFAIFAAKRYGLRLIIPLIDEYDYYHGGYRAFLRWRGLSDSDPSPFYDINSKVHADFLNYLNVIFDHLNPFTQLPIKADPTIMMWETGNELKNPPKAWTEAVSKWIHNKAPNQLVASGRYGVSQDELKIASLDAVTNHFYPPKATHYRADAAKAASHGKVYYAGEFDWSGRSKDWGLLGWVLIPIFATLVVLLVGASGKLFPIVIEWSTNQAQKPGQTKPQRKRSIIIRQSHIALFLTLVVTPITGGLIYATSIKDSGLEAFLSETQKISSKGSGDLYWSLFGHDDRCCEWIEHPDGFSMHYPGRTDEERGSVARMIKHAYTLKRQTRPEEKNHFKIEGKEDDWFGIGDRVGVKCPQSLDK